MYEKHVRGFGGRVPTGMSEISSLSLSLSLKLNVSLILRVSLSLSTKAESWDLDTPVEAPKLRKQNVTFDYTQIKKFSGKITPGNKFFDQNPEWIPLKVEKRKQTSVKWPRFERRWHRWRKFSTLTPLRPHPGISLWWLQFRYWSYSPWNAYQRRSTFDNRPRNYSEQQNAKTYQSEKFWIIFLNR